MQNKLCIFLLILSLDNDDGKIKLLEVKKQLLEESRKRNNLLEKLSSQMDTIIHLKKKKIEMLEK